MVPIKIKFWGVRGSIPTPGPSTIRYGGNTSCVEIIYPGKSRFIIDAGSGIRELGKELLASREPIHGHIFLSHFHWDHIQGLPFFKPAFKPGNDFTIYGCDEPDVDLTKIISMQMNPIYFPVAISDMNARLNFKTIQEEHLTVESVDIHSKFMNHPGYTLGFRFTYEERSVVYISDNEPFLHNPDFNANRNNGEDSLEDRFESYIENNERALVDFIRDADILIHDAQYFPDEYRRKKTWGHSPYTYAVDIAVKGNVKQLILFHHDPDHNDDVIDEIAALSRDRLRRHRYDIPCAPAREGEILVI